MVIQKSRAPNQDLCVDSLCERCSQGVEAKAWGHETGKEGKPLRGVMKIIAMGKESLSPLGGV